jgi:hypothetical protein
MKKMGAPGGVNLKRIGPNQFDLKRHLKPSGARRKFDRGGFYPLLL